MVNAKAAPADLPSDKKLEFQSSMKSNYFALFTAKVLSNLIVIVGVIIFAVSALGAVSELSATYESTYLDESETVDETILEPLQLGVAEEVSVAESSDAIIELFETNAVEIFDYADFQAVVLANTSFFEEVISPATVLDSPNRLGSDTTVIVTDGDSTCELTLDGVVTAVCR